MFAFDAFFYSSSMLSIRQHFIIKSQLSKSKILFNKITILVIPVHKCIQTHTQLSFICKIIPNSNSIFNYRRNFICIYQIFIIQ